LHRPSRREECAAPEGAALGSSLDLVQITSLDKGDEFIPFGVRQPNSVCILADPDALIRDLDFRAERAVRAKT